MSTDDILDQISRAIDDRELSADAARQTPVPQPGSEGSERTWISDLYQSVPNIAGAEVGPVGRIVQVVVQFTNGYSASVCRPSVHDEPGARHQVAVLDAQGEITYDTPVTGDVVTNLDDDGVLRTLRQIAGLRPARSIADMFDTIIHACTRAELLADGTLVAVPGQIAREAGITVPVALTGAAWQDAVAWTDADNTRKGTVQDQDGRLWDVVWMLSRALLRNRNTQLRTLTYELYRVPRPGAQLDAELIALTINPGQDDEGQPVLTIGLPGEDL